MAQQKFKWNIRKDDEVVVVAGDEKGKTGRVLWVDRKRERVAVQGLNYVYKHLRRSQEHPHGDRLRKEAPMHISNVRRVKKGKGEEAE